MNIQSKDPSYPGWRKYDQRLPNDCTLQTEIINLLGHLRPHSGDRQKVDGGVTNLIKIQLLEMGYSRGYCGYANLRKEFGKPPISDDRPSADLENYIQHQTRKINDHIDSLRLKFEFGNHTFFSREWLYDIHFYRDTPNTHYMPENLFMAGEIELWGKRKGKNGKNEHSGLPYSEICYDFQKLLVTNAQLRVMICRLKDETILYAPNNGLAAYFDNAIRNYNELKTGDSFLLACYIRRELHYAFVSKS